MKKSLLFLTLALALSWFITSCGDATSDAVPIESLETYEDKVTGFKVDYPANWDVREETGKRLYVLSSPAGEDRFKFQGDYSTGFPVARVTVNAFRTDSTQTLDSVAAKFKMFEESIYQEDKMTIDGQPARKYTYSFDLNSGPFMGEMYIAMADQGMATILKLEAFDGTFDKYRENFDKIVNSLVLAKTPAGPVADTITEEIEADPPSMTLRDRSGDGFTIGISENFSKESFNSNALSYSAFLGQRRGDSYILIEKFNAKGLGAKELAEQNKAAFGNGTPQQSTLGGETAYVINYAPSSNVKGKVWFAVKNDMLYRVILNWYAPEEKDFYPAFEKSIKSFKFQ